MVGPDLTVLFRHPQAKTPARPGLGQIGPSPTNEKERIPRKRRQQTINQLPN